MLAAARSVGGGWIKFIRERYFCCWKIVFDSGRDRFQHARVVFQQQAYRLAPDPYNPNLTSILDEAGQVVDSFRSAKCGAYFLALLEAGASVNPHRVLGTRIGAWDASRSLPSTAPEAERQPVSC